MILNVEKGYNNPILRRKADPVNVLSDEDKRILIPSMIETMHALSGIGLAAPQVGISRMIIVVNPTQEKGKDGVLINPKITKSSGRTTFTEGCLSLPGVMGDVKRAKKITVEAQDINGKNVSFETDGLMAIVLQHEIDHINGMLFADRLPFLKKRALIKKSKDGSVSLALRHGSLRNGPPL